MIVQNKAKSHTFFRYPMTYKNKYVSFYLGDKLRKTWDDEEFSMSEAVDSNPLVNYMNSATDHYVKKKQWKYKKEIKKQNEQIKNKHTTKSLSIPRDIYGLRGMSFRRFFTAKGQHAMLADNQTMAVNIRKDDQNSFLDCVHSFKFDVNCAMLLGMK